jgi:hypothetical protein
MGAPQLNIKDVETTRMVRELAELTGETQTEVVRKAVQEKLATKKAEADIERRRREMDFETTLTDIRKIQAEVRKHMKLSDFLTDDDLYDEWGLPK